MTIPTTARETPVGEPLEDGHSTKIANLLFPDISFWEKSVQPFGWDGGDPIDLTTMFNELVKTKAGRSLFDTTDGQAVAAWDPRILNRINSIINRNTYWTTHLPNGDKWNWCGMLRKAEPQNHEEGTQPTINLTFTLTNRDPNTKAESLPEFVPADGTGT